MWFFGCLLSQVLNFYFVGRVKLSWEEEWRTMAANRNLEKMASIDAQLRLLVPRKVSEDDKLIEYDALLLDRFLDILQDLHGEDLKETVCHFLFWPFVNLFFWLMVDFHCCPCDQKFIFLMIVDWFTVWSVKSVRLTWFMTFFLKKKKKGLVVEVLIDPRLQFCSDWKDQ